MIFINAIEKRQKMKMQRSIREYVLKFLGFQKHKDVIYSVKYELPKLFNFEQCGMFIYDKDSEDLFAISLDEEGDKLAKLIDPYPYERDFCISEGQIVRFPLKMGISGFVHEADAVNWMNDVKN